MKTILLKNIISEDLSYPFIALHRITNCIVLFSSGTTGMVIYTDSEHGNPVGTFSQHWNVFSLPQDWQILYDVTINFKM